MFNYTKITVEDFRVTMKCTTKVCTHCMSRSRVYFLHDLEKFSKRVPLSYIKMSEGLFAGFSCNHLTSLQMLNHCAQLVEDSMLKLDIICREANVMLIFARSYGLTGFVRISVKVCTMLRGCEDDLHILKHYQG